MTETNNGIMNWYACHLNGLHGSFDDHKSLRWKQRNSYLFLFMLTYCLHFTNLFHVVEVFLQKSTLDITSSQLALDIPWEWVCTTG